MISGKKATKYTENPAGTAAAPAGAYKNPAGLYCTRRGFLISVCYAAISSFFLFLAAVMMMMAAPAPSTAPAPAPIIRESLEKMEPMVMEVDFPVISDTVLSACLKYT